MQDDYQQKRKKKPDDQRPQKRSQGGGYQDYEYYQQRGHGGQNNNYYQQNRNYQGRGGYNNNNNNQGNYHNQGNRHNNNYQQNYNQNRNYQQRQPKEHHVSNVYRKKTTKISQMSLLQAYENSTKWAQKADYVTKFPEIFVEDKMKPFSDIVFQLDPNDGLVPRMSKQDHKYQQQMQENKKEASDGKKMEMFDFGMDRADPIQAMKDKIKVESGYHDEEYDEDKDGELLGGDDEDLETELEKENRRRLEAVRNLQQKKLEDDDNYSDIDEQFEKKLKNNEYIENEDAFEQLWLESKQKQKEEEEAEQERKEQKRLNGEPESEEEEDNDPQWGNENLNNKQQQNQYGNQQQQQQQQGGFNYNAGFDFLNSGPSSQSNNNTQNSMNSMFGNFGSQDSGNMGSQQQSSMGFGGFDFSRVGFQEEKPQRNDDQGNLGEGGDIFKFALDQFQKQQSSNEDTSGGGMFNFGSPFMQTGPSQQQQQQQQQTQQQKSMLPASLRNKVGQQQQQQQQQTQPQPQPQPQEQQSSGTHNPFFTQQVIDHELSSDKFDPEFDQGYYNEMLKSLIDQESAKKQPEEKATGAKGDSSTEQKPQANDSGDNQINPNVLQKLQMLQRLQQEQKEAKQKAQKRPAPRFKPNPMYPSFIFMYFSPEYEMKCWYYLDLKRQVQGPFSGKQMDEWYSGGHFPIELKVTLGTGNEYKTIKELAELIVTQTINGDGPPPDKRQPPKPSPVQELIQGNPDLVKQTSGEQDLHGDKAKTLDEVETGVSNKGPDGLEGFGSQPNMHPAQGGNQQQRRYNNNQKNFGGANPNQSKPNPQQNANYQHHVQQQHQNQQYQGGYNKHNQVNNNYNNPKNPKKFYQNQGQHGQQYGNYNQQQGQMGVHKPHNVPPMKQQGVHHPMQNFNAGPDSGYYKPMNNNTYQQKQQNYGANNYNNNPRAKDVTNQIKDMLGLGHLEMADQGGAGNKKNQGPPVIDNSDFPTLGD